MTPRDRFIAALERRPVAGLVPHFELVFFLTMEAFGRVHPSQRHYGQWSQMSETERRLHREDMADLHLATAERYGHSAIFIHPQPSCDDELLAVAEIIRKRSGDRYYLTCHGDPTFGIPGGDHMEAFCFRIADEPGTLHEEATRNMERELQRADRLAASGLIDGITMCSDYCMNGGPFLSPPLFDEFVAPYLAGIIQGFRARGLYVIKHTDGNIMPIIDSLIDAGPHALHSLDPQGHVDLGHLVATYGDRVAFCGNVNCGLLQTGSLAEAEDDVRRCLRQGLAAPGFIFCTSNCVYTGLQLERYERMLEIWRSEGHRPAPDLLPAHAADRYRV